MVPIQAEADELIVFIWAAGIGGALAFVLIYPIRYKTVLIKILDYDNSDRMLFYVTMLILLIVSSLITRMFYVKRCQKDIASRDDV